MTSATSSGEGQFRNAILCEDIREEVGNKKSLMGVIAGDIAVASLPATIKIAFFLEYQPDPADGERLEVEMTLFQDGTELMKGKFNGVARPPRSATFIIPTGLATFDNAANLRMLVAVNGRAPQEVMNKRVHPAPATS